MHSNISIADGVYGNLSDNDLKEQIALLGISINLNNTKGIDEIKIMTKKILEKLKKI